MKKIAEFCFPTTANLGSGSWSSGKCKAIAAGVAVSMLFAGFFIFSGAMGGPLWLYLLCLGYGGWVVNAGFSWVRSFERATEEARRERLAAFDPPHADDEDKDEKKSDPS